MHRITLILALVLVATAQAEDRTSKHRLIGLSAPERIEDFRDVMKTVPDIRLDDFDTANAEVTLHYDLAKLIPNLNPKKPPSADDITKRLDDVIGIASTRSFAIKPLSTVPKDKLVQIDIQVGILDCKGCRYGVYLAVANLEGVERAAVDPQTGVLTAWTDATKTNRDALIEALKKARVEFSTP